MHRLVFRGLLERKARTAFTLLAVVLGVTLIAGTFVLTDTISKSFDGLVAAAGENVDVKVLAPNGGDGIDNQTVTLTFPASVEARVKAVDGVAAASGAYREVAVTVVDDRGIAPRALAEAQMPFVDQHAEATREVTVAVGQQLDVFQTLMLAPLIHDKGVVDRNAIYFVDAQPLISCVVAFESR